jgi:hypothetical protein
MLRPLRAPLPAAPPNRRPMKPFLGEENNIIKSKVAISAVKSANIALK